jgi:hypothetical protein
MSQQSLDNETHVWDWWLCSEYKQQHIDVYIRLNKLNVCICTSVYLYCQYYVHVHSRFQYFRAFCISTIHLFLARRFKRITVCVLYPLQFTFFSHVKWDFLTAS